MPSRYLLALPLLAAGVLAGCGGSSNSDTANLKLPPSASQTLSYSATSTSTTTTSSTTTPNVPTPTSGPLATEPKITVPKGAAPKSLQTKDLIKGTGAAAAVGDTVSVNYVGALYSNGTVFDASWLRHQVFSTPLEPTSVIQGWVDGIAGMKVGGRRELIIPPALGYGKNGTSGIPGNATLIFVVDLLAVTPPG